MHPERWKQVDKILQSALDQAPHERDAFLGDACAGDQALEREVRSLLELESRAGRFLERPAMEVAARAVARQQSPPNKQAPEDAQERSQLLPPGTKLGSYEIVAAVGAGGMGEVYHARDTRLDRS